MAVKRADLARFDDYVSAGDYTSALGIAEKFGLDTDDVYKLQWEASDYGIEAVRNVLSRVKDSRWVVKKCTEKVCPSFDAMNALLSCGLRFTEVYVYPDNRISSLQGGTAGDKASWFRAKRLRLLQYKDRLDSFLGINSGRYSQDDYNVFRSASLHRVALGFAQRGKTGPLSILYKRHLYSLAPYTLQLLDAIPEALPPRNYSQLLPDRSPPKVHLARNREDWVEKEEVLKAVHADRRGLSVGEEVGPEDSTEHMVKLSRGLVWPTNVEVVEWYKLRAREIDKTCGLLENCLSLLDFGILKGFTELETHFEDVSDLHGLVYSSDSGDCEVDVKLADWEGLSTYEKFRMILNGVKEETAADRLREQAIPFMIRHQALPFSALDTTFKRNAAGSEVVANVSQSFLVQWLKETAQENKLSVCSAIFAECCKEQKPAGRLFSSDEELVNTVLFCIYAYSLTDEWNLMSSMLARLPGREMKVKDSSPIVDDSQGARGLRKGFMKAFRGAVSGKAGDAQMAMSPLVGDVDETKSLSLGSGYISVGQLSEAVKRQVKQAEGHVEAGKLLLQYQVAKPIKFFLTCQEDVKGSKQLLRILMLKFSNSEQAKSDNGWATLWRDLRILQEKAFPSLEKEYFLSELCQGMLQAGKFSLVKNYLKGTGTVMLQTEKAERLVLNAARDYFYSAPDLDSSAIGKAKQCLNLIPPSPQLTAEMDLIIAITEQLPSLGVTLLPVQFRQLKSNMEAVKMAISAQAGAEFLSIEEIMELARLLGLSSSDEMSAIEAVIAREAAAGGDFGLALDFCLGLVRKGHGPIWDLCAALGRGPDFEQLDLETRKELLGFALGHCDEDSVQELLSAWKEFDYFIARDTLRRKVGDSVLSDQETGSASHYIEDYQDNEQSLQASPQVKKNAPGLDYFCPPWLLEVSSGKTQDTLESVDVRAVDELGEESMHNLPKECRSQSAEAVALIMSALASNDIVAGDKLVLMLAQEAMSRPFSKEGDTVGCGYLLNLRNAHLGAELLQTELEQRENYEEVHQVMEWALSFSTMQEAVLDTQSPEERRHIVIETLKGCRSSGPGGISEDNSADKFWRNFRVKAVEILQVSEESRRLQKVLPGVDARRFLSRDESYIRENMFSHIDSMKMHQEKLLPNMLTLADQYKIEQWLILERYLLALLRADWTSEEEIITEISGYWARFLSSPDRLQDTLAVYDQVISEALNGLRKGGPDLGSGEEGIIGHKRALVGALLSLSNNSLSVEGQPLSSDVAEPSQSDNLHKVRFSVWQKLCQFTEDLQVPLQSRILILELLESIRNGTVPRQEILTSVLPRDEDIRFDWGKWEAEGTRLQSVLQSDESAEESSKSGSRSYNVLLALKSTHLISVHWPGWEITPSDLRDPQAAAALFDRLLVGASSLEHAKTLRALLEEWGSVFGFGQDQGDESNVTAEEDEKDNWGEGWDDWGETILAAHSAHTLHTCWKALLQRLAELGGVREALSVLDAALVHPMSVLITEDEAQELVATIGQLNPCVALQLSLLLPYNSPQVHGLQMLEEKLKLENQRLSAKSLKKCNDIEEGESSSPLSFKISDLASQDLMAVVLSSGLLPSTNDDPSSNMVFSSLCLSLGRLVLQANELQLSIKPSNNECLESVDNVPLCAVAVQFFVAELTKARKYGPAGAIVLETMRVHPALTVWNASHIALQRYLSTQADGAGLEALIRRGNHYFRNQKIIQLSHLRNTLQSLTSRLEEVLRSASKVLAKDMNRNVES